MYMFMLFVNHKLQYNCIVYIFTIATTVLFGKVRSHRQIELSLVIAKTSFYIPGNIVSVLFTYHVVLLMCFRQYIYISRFGIRTEKLEQEGVSVCVHLAVECDDIPWRICNRILAFSHNQDIFGCFVSALKLMGTAVCAYIIS